jgi:hypothetical protein
LSRICSSIKITFKDKTNKFLSTFVHLKIISTLQALVKGQNEQAFTCFGISEDVDTSARDDPFPVDGVSDHPPPHRRKWRYGSAANTSSGHLVFSLNKNKLDLRQKLVIVSFSF